MNLDLYHFVWGVAAGLDRCGEKMTGDELADLVNQNGFRSGYDAPYEGRGTFALINAVQRWLNFDKALPEEARKIHRAFTKRDGSYAYE